jgi:hypothetical protein
MIWVASKMHFKFYCTASHSHLHTSASFTVQLHTATLHTSASIIISFTSVSCLFCNVPCSQNNKWIFKLPTFWGLLKLDMSWGLRRSKSGPAFRGCMFRHSRTIIRPIMFAKGYCFRTKVVLMVKILQVRVVSDEHTAHAAAPLLHYVSKRGLIFWKYLRCPQDKLLQDLKKSSPQVNSIVCHLLLFVVWSTLSSFSSVPPTEHGNSASWQFLCIILYH